MVSRLKRNLGWIGLVLLCLGGLLAWVESPLVPGALSSLRVGGVGTVLLLVSAAVLAVHLVVNWEQVRFFSRARASRYGLQALLYTLTVGGILLVVNLLVARHDLRLDTTTERLHSLAPQSNRVLADLEVPVTALAFVGRAHPARRPTEDLLTLMEEGAHGKLRYELIDPVLDPDRAREYDVSRTVEIVFETERDKARTTTVTETAFLNAMLEAARRERPTVCFATGHGERDPRSAEQMGLATVASALEDERYRIGTANLLTVDELEESCNVLVLAGPTERYREGVVEKLRSFLARGGGLLVLAEPQVETGMADLLARHGVALGNDQVVEMLPLQNFGPLNPIGMKVSDHPITDPLGRGRFLSTVFFDARSAEVHEKVRYRPEVEATCLVLSGEQNTYAESEPGVVDLKPDPEQDRMGPICLGVAATFDPYKVPVLSGEEPPPQGLPIRRLVVWGDVDFANNFYASMGGNTTLFLNSVAWLARRGELLDLRPRSRKARAILLDPSQIRLITAVCVLGLPAVVLVGGLGLWLHRRRL